MWRKITAVFGARDCIVLIGLGMMAGGLYMVWPPAALIVPGAILVWKAIIHGPARAD